MSLETYRFRSPVPKYRQRRWPTPVNGSWIF